MQTSTQNSGDTRLPGWVPDAARNYLAHTERGETIRALARQSKVHASTVLRQIRRFEMLRDDPLIDSALRHLSQCIPSPETAPDVEGPMMNIQNRPVPVQSSSQFEPEAARVLRRLTETGVILAVAKDMEMGVIVREGPDGVPQRIAVVERRIAEAMALQDWVLCSDPAARIARYHITAAGRTALKRMLATSPKGPEADETDRAERLRPDDDSATDGLIRHLRSTMAESPLCGLARRRDKDGQPFLDRALVNAGERLREDFELAQMGSIAPIDWESLLQGGPSSQADAPSDRAAADGARAARLRVVAALAALGPGLADVVLRCCCLLEGLESLEKRMNWSARSGKIVLRIALQRLRQHYLDSQGRFGPMIG
jgi:hypothetical protein